MVSTFTNVTTTNDDGNVAYHGQQYCCHSHSSVCWENIDYFMQGSV